MKKVLSVVVSCLLCICMVGCISDEEKLQNMEKEWFDNLSYTEFKLGEIDMGAGLVHYNFYILSEDEVLRSSIELDFISEETDNIRAFESDALILHTGDWWAISVAFGEEMEPKDVRPQNIPLTVRYTTTDGEEVSKEYILDFTQEPFWDQRDLQTKEKL